MNLTHHKTTSVIIIASYIFAYVIPLQTFAQPDTSSVNTGTTVPSLGLQSNNPAGTAPSPESPADTLIAADSLKATSAVSQNTQDSLQPIYDARKSPVQELDTSNNGKSDSLTSQKSGTPPGYYGDGFKGYHAAGRGVPTPGTSSGQRRALRVDTLQSGVVMPPPARSEPPADSSVSTPAVKLDKKGKIITGVIIAACIGSIVAALYLKNKKEAEAEKKDRIPAPPLPPDF